MTDVAAVPTRLLAECRTLTLEAGLPYFGGDFARDSFLVVEEGFVVVRALGPPDSRSVITCEGGAGEILLPPAPHEALVALTSASVSVIDADARTRMLASPALAERIVEQLALVVRRKQEATSNLAPTRHADRVRRRLTQL